MRQDIDSFSQAFNNLENNEAINLKLFIVGSVIRPGRKVATDPIGPLEIIIDDGVSNYLREVTNSVILSTSDFELFDIDDVDEASESIKRYIEITHLGELGVWKQTISDPTGCDSAHEYINQESFRARALIAYVKVGDHELYLLKSVPESVFLKQKGIAMLRYVTGRGCYELESGEESKIYLDRQWDALICNNHALLLNEGKVLEMFKYYEKFKDAAMATLNRISGLDFLADASHLIEFISSRVTFQKKLARASAYAIDEVKRERIVDLINDGVINLNLDADGKVECTTAQEVRVLMDVLLDNFVSSLITDESYKAINKAKIATQV